MGNPRVDQRAAVLREASVLPGVRRAYWDGRITVKKETLDRLKVEIYYTADYKLTLRLVESVVARNKFECWIKIDQQTKDEYAAELKQEIKDTTQDLQLLGLLLSQKQLQLKSLTGEASSP